MLEKEAKTVTLGSKIIATLLSTLLLSTLSSAVIAQPNINTDYRFYSISPTNLSEILGELNSKSPIRKEGRVAHGITRVSLQWRPVLQPVARGCKLTSVESDLTLRYTLPKLDLLEPNPELQAEFDKSYEILHTHELGHGKLAIQAVNTIEKQLVGMTNPQGCELLEQNAITTAKEIYSYYKKMELEYDKLTDHGRAQSAIDTPIPAPQS
jgi:predicted secreted Zn-dependent protease